MFTVQIDFISAERFGISYADSDGSRRAPVVVHRSSIGCFERTMAFLIEHLEGRFPCWLAPVQIVLLPGAEQHLSTVESLCAKLLDAEIRVEVDGRNETLSRRIREARLLRAPFWGVVGEKESQANSISLHDAENGKRFTLSVEALIDLVKARAPL